MLKLLRDFFLKSIYFFLINSVENTYKDYVRNLTISYKFRILTKIKNETRK